MRDPEGADMNQKWYRAGITKAILIITAHIMVVVMAVCYMHTVLSPAIREEVCDGDPAEKYKDSSDFASRMRTYSARAVGEISAGKLFETDGEYDPDKLVDVELYYNTGMLDEDESPVQVNVLDADGDGSISGEMEDSGKIEAEEQTGEETDDSNAVKAEKKAVDGADDSNAVKAEEMNVDEAEDSSVKHKGRRLLYRLGDLLTWYEDNHAEQSAAEQIVVCKRTDDTFRYYEISDFYELIKSEELRFIAADDDAGLTDQNILQDMEYGYGMPEGIFRGIQDQEGKLLYSDCWLYDGKYALEQCKPVGAESLLEIANEEPEWNGQLNEMYTMLDITIDGLGEMYATYQNYGDGLSEGDTNFSYIYVDIRNKRVYTNKKEYEAYAGVRASLADIKKIGNYAIVRPKLADFDSNMDLEAEDWRDVIKYTGPVSEDFIFAAAVDISYPIQDEFYRENSLYEKWGVGVEKTIAWAAAAAFVFLVCALWLAVVAGRSCGDEELHLNGFDRWKTELAAAVVIAGWAALVFAGGAAADLILPVSVVSQMTENGIIQQTTYLGGTESLLEIAWFSLIAGWTCTMFLIGFLSLVRRLKAKIVWENSILRSGCLFVELMFQNLNSILKTIALFGAFMLVQLFLYIEIGGTISFGSILIILAGDTAAFVWLCFKAVGKCRIKEGIQHIAGGEVQYTISLDGLFGEQKETAELLNRISEGLDAALAVNMKNERLKTDLITNVSHDIKTPLTSIINYVELLKQEQFEDPKLKRYIEVLEQKSQRLKTLTEDVVEASKVSSGNITLEYMDLNFAEMLQQTSGEFEEKFKARGLQEILTLTGEGAVIRADGRRTWRILENIYNNAAKYAMEGTRIYADLTVRELEVSFSLKNISEQPLNISADELTERFIRGDISRSTEGSGLGLSIAKTLTEMQGGKFQLYLDGDLFKVMISFPRVLGTG